MKLRFRLFCRASGMYYVEDTETRQQESLKIKDKNAAQGRNIRFLGKERKRSNCVVTKTRVDDGVYKIVVRPRAPQKAHAM